MVLCITASIPLSASAATTDKAQSGFTYTDKYGKWTYELTASGNGYKITGYDKSMTDIEIPSSINGKPVVEIGDEAFYWCRYLTSIKIPNSVIAIGNNAFGFCDSVRNIEVSLDNNNYSSIDGVLFNKTKSKLIWYPAGKLTDSYTIPKTINTIDSYAFSSC